MARRSTALYTQFCIGVELGDSTLVQDLVMRGADTMVSYGVDGNITTPMQSAMKRGDMPMALALLTSRTTKVNLADLDMAPRLKKEMVTPMLLRRITESLEDGAKELLLERTVEKPHGRQPVKLSLSDCVVEHLREIPRASSTDRPRCPPGDPAISSEDEAVSTEDSETDSQSDEEMEKVSSIASSAEDSSVEGDS